MIRLHSWIVVIMLVVGMGLDWAPAMADQAPAGDGKTAETARPANDLAVMEAFKRQQDEVGEAVRIDVERKHQILFFMGFALLVLILLTAGYGIAMAIYGKQVFVRHMILAGLSVTLAIAHSIVAIVWFFPF